MKLSVELYTIADKFGDYKAVELAKEAGFDAIDYSYYWDKETGGVLDDGYRDYANNLKNHLDKVGIECNQAHAPFSFSYGCALDTSEPKFLRLIRAMESASILGAENIVVHSITVPKYVDFKEYNIRFYKSLVPYCEKFNINVCVENLFAKDTKRQRLIGKLGSPKELSDIVEKIASPRIVACIDIGHASLTGYEPEEFIEKMNPKIVKSLHIQDTDYISDKHILPFTGELNWEAIMKSLKKIKYEGDLTFEIFKFLEKFPDDLMPEALKFSATVGRYLISSFNETIED